MIPIFRALAMTVTACAAGLVQTIPQTAANRFALVTVADQRGRAVVDVGPDDFVVEEGGQLREILDVRVADYPIAVVIDNSDSSNNSALAHNDFRSMQRGIAHFIERLGPRPVEIVSTADVPKLVASFEDERQTVLTRLDALTAEKNAQPLGAAALAAQALHNTGALFSALVIVTGSPVEVSVQAPENLVAPVVDSRATVHVVAYSAPGVTMALWRGLVNQTRGEYTAIYSAASYQPALDRLANRLTTELLIEYLVPVGSKASDPKVGIRLPGAHVRGLGVAPR